MPTEQFPIKNWITGAVMLTAEIECDPASRPTIKLGLAVKWAVKSKADLSWAYLSWAYLSGADLSGAYLMGAYLSRAYLMGAYLMGANLSKADLSGADLSGAYLMGANLSKADLSGADLSGAYLMGANLSGAKIQGDKLTRLIARADRSDGYQFAAFELENGSLKIKAGCRWFTPAEYLAHVAAEYPDTDKAAETLAILDFIDARAGQMGVIPKKEA